MHFELGTWFLESGSHLPHEIIRRGGEDPSLKLVSHVDGVVKEGGVLLVDDPPCGVAANTAVLPNQLWLCL